MSRVRDFGNENRGRLTQERRKKAQEFPCDDETVETLREALKD